MRVHLAMSTTIHLSFSCSVCSQVIKGDYEEDDFDYPVYCPRCGRQNQIPRPDSMVAAGPSRVADATTGSLNAGRPDSTVAAAASRVAWRFRPTASERPVVPLRNCVAVDGQGRLIAALGAELVCLVPSDTRCEIAWKFSAADLIPGSPVIGPDGTCFAHSSDGMLHAIDTDGRPVRAPTKVGPALGWATPLVDAASRVWVSASAGGLLRVDASGQTAARSFLRSPCRFDCTGVLTGDVLYLGAEDQFLHAISLTGERGRELWNQSDKIGLTGWYINSAVILADGPIVLAVSRDDQVYAFEPTGKLCWQTSLGGRAMGNPVLTPDGCVVIGLSVATGGTATVTGRLVAIAVKTGQFAWRREFDSPLESTPVVGDSGEIYVGDNSGAIHGLDLRGERLWTEPAGCGVRSAGTLLPSGQVVFGLDDGSLMAMHCQSRGLAVGWPKLLGTLANRCPTSSENSGGDSPSPPTNAEIG